MVWRRGTVEQTKITIWVSSRSLMGAKWPKSAVEDTAEIWIAQAVGSCFAGCKVHRRRSTSGGDDAAFVAVVERACRDLVSPCPGRARGNVDDRAAPMVALSNFSDRSFVSGPPRHL